MELAVCQQTFKKYAGRGLAGRSLACSVCTAEQYSPVCLWDAAAVDFQCIWSFVVAGLWECVPRGFRREDIGFYCMFLLTFFQFLFQIFQMFSCRTLEMWVICSHLLAGNWSRLCRKAYVMCVVIQEALYSVPETN